MNRLASVAALVLAGAAPARADFFVVNALPPGTGPTYLYNGVANGGAAALGYAVPFGGGGGWFRWTPGGGAQPLGNMNGGAVFSLTGLSADGRTVSGNGFAPGAGYQGFRWTTAGGATFLGVRAGGRYGFSEANGVSADGQVIVGNADGAGPAFDGEAIRRTPAGGFQGLGILPGDAFSSATAASADGAVVVGISGQGNPFGPYDIEAFRWENGVMKGLGALPGLTGQSRATGVSADGAVVVGTSLGFLAGPPLDQAFRWTAAGGLQPLGTIPGPIPPQFGYSRANGVSGDGNLVIGSSNGLAALWDPVNGFRRLDEILTARGEDLAGYQLIDGTAISPDGSAVGGVAVGPNGQFVGFVATFAPAAVPEPASVGLAAAGGLGLAGYARRRRAAKG